jgi:arabinoxylan arabinofuranohydrolase
MKKVLFVFKRPNVTLLIASLLLFCSCASMGAGNQSKNDAKTTQYIHHGAGNPYLPLWEHLPDGEPRVFEDPDNPGKLRIYIIGSHDVSFRGYCGPDIRAWSAPVEDLSSWRDEGPIFTYQVGNRWDVMFAPDLVEVKRKDGKKEYYLYPHSRGRNREAMVAKGDRPDGPFTPVNVTEDGTRTIPGSTMGFDPAVFVEYITDRNDPDYEIGFRAYGYWGFQRSSAGQLDQNTMYSLRPGTQAIDRFIPDTSRSGGRRFGGRGGRRSGAQPEAQPTSESDSQETNYPYLFPGEDPASFSFFEAASIRKIGNKYVWIYSGRSGSEYGIGGATATLRYAYGDSPLGPWKSGGVLVDARAVVPNRDGTRLQTSYSGHNTHGSVQLINDQYYVFYHRAPRGFGNARQPMVAPVKIEWDEKPVSEGGKITIRGYDPYAEDNIWTAKSSQGNEYTGAEVTSEGFHIYGLDPYQYYSAGYACYLSNQQLVQDSWDMWDNNMPLADVQNGNIIGYKYFGFGGLDKDKKGLKAFEGTRPGNNTAFNLFLTPKTTNAFKINVWLDGPWDNDTWRGKKIGEINVPANAAQEITKFTIDVASSVDNLGEKHAVFLVAEGPGSEGLCDIIGLGFSSDKKKIVRPVPPSVSIKVGGEAIELPATPVRSTNANGITSVDLYEATYTIGAGVTEIPQVSASASDRKVKVDVTQAESKDGTAVVKFDNNGVVKTYHVVFASE